MTVSTASIQYGVPYTTLYRIVGDLDKQKPRNKLGGQTVLSPAEETMIVDSLIKCSEWGFPLTKNDIRNVVRDYLNRLVSVTRM